MESFAYDVVETARAIRRDFDRRAAALGTTRAQWRVLARLGREDGMRQVELADGLDVEPITLCRMVDRLAEAGLVERRPDETDRRAWRIHLTQKAKPVIESLHALAEDFHRDLLDGVSGADRETAQRVLARLGREDGLRQVELADALDVEPITLCRMIDRLSEAGLVERRPDEEDRRAWRIHLTPKALPIIEKLRALADTFLEEALAGVPEKEQALVTDVLARIRGNLSRGGPARRAS